MILTIASTSVWLWWRKLHHLSTNTTENSIDSSNYTTSMLRLQQEQVISISLKANFSVSSAISFIEILTCWCISVATKVIISTTMATPKQGQSLILAIGTPPHCKRPQLSTAPLYCPKCDRNVFSTVCCPSTQTKCSSNNTTWQTLRF